MAKLSPSAGVYYTWYVPIHERERLLFHAWGVRRGKVAGSRQAEARRLTDKPEASLI